MTAAPFCRNCGNVLPASGGFCSRCGASASLQEEASPSVQAGTTSPVRRVPVLGIVIGGAAVLILLCAVAAQVSHSGVLEGAGLSGTYIASEAKTMPSIAPEVVFNRDGSFCFHPGEGASKNTMHGTYKINGNGSTLSFLPDGTALPPENDDMGQALAEALSTATLTQDKNNFRYLDMDFEKWTEDADTTPLADPEPTPAAETPGDAPIRLSDSVTLTANDATPDGCPGWYTSAFHLDRQTSLTVMLSAQSSCQADITTVSNLTSFKTKKAFDGFCAMTNETGTKRCTLPPGEYYFVVRNSSDAPNPLSFQISY